VFKKFWPGNFTRRDHFEYLREYEKIISEENLRNMEPDRLI
jgi:hypothetical protein